MFEDDSSRSTRTMRKMRAKYRKDVENTPLYTQEHLQSIPQGIEMKADSVEEWKRISSLHFHADKYLESQRSSRVQLPV